MKVFVLGNCQVTGLKKSLSALLPDAEVSGCFPFGRGDLDQVAEKIRGMDYIFTQKLPDNIITALGISSDSVRSRVYTIPNIAFPGYHPDCVYLPGINAANSSLPTDYNSAIAVAGFLRGRTPEETLTLYNTYIYAISGYFNSFSMACRNLEAHFKACEFDLSEHLKRWVAKGPFMHTINHPRINVLLDIANMAVKRAGLSPVDVPDGAVKDDLAHFTRWPIYPELARRLGLEGSTMLYLNPDPSRPAVMTLLEYVQNCFKIFPTLDREKMLIPEVRAILQHI
ncbi:WcbI family polysaccharide biosynthesis putative acetyltransferase [Azospirillum argentinense]